MEFIDRIQLALHPEIFIPENVASLPSCNMHTKKDDIENRLSLFLSIPIPTTRQPVIDLRCAL